MSRLSERKIREAMGQPQAVYDDNGDRLDVRGTDTPQETRKRGRLVDRADRLPRGRKTPPTG